MKINSSAYLSNKSNKTGQLFFNLGTFFLATALPISGIFFIIAIFISFYETKFDLLNNKWNLLILFIGGLFLVNALRFTLINQDFPLPFEKTTSLLDLFNWLPLFVVFISFQYYLKSQSQRELFSKYLISGTIPVLISCILQSRFNIFGPFTTLNGLIVIFNKSISQGEAVSGLFSNPNYTGIWLSLTLPILFLLIFKTKQFNINKLLLFTILISLIYIIFLTLSRNALAGLISTILVLFGFKKFLFFLISIFFIFISFGFLESFLNIKNIIFIGELPFNNLLSKFSINNISNIVEFTRIKIWINTLKLIFQKPIFGFGASTFPIIFYNFTNLKMQHSHNMPLQLAYDYGIPLSFLLTSFIIFLFFKSWMNIFRTANLNADFDLNKCWIASCLVAILNHINDITYYDGKISILIWIFLAGLKCILDETNILTIKEKNPNL